MRLAVAFLITALQLVQGPPAPSTGSVAGQVTDSVGGVMPGVSVVAWRGPQEWRATTGANGRYRIDGIAIGEVGLTARLEGFEPIHVTAVTVSAGKTVEWNGVMDVLRRTSKPMLSFITALTGPNAVSCGSARANQTEAELGDALKCALDAESRHEPFWLINRTFGVDSEIADGLLTGSDGKTRRFTWDSAPCGGPGCEPRFSTELCASPRVSKIGGRLLRFSCYTPVSQDLDVYSAIHQRN